MILFKQKQSGFSLVETLVAISVLLIVIVGPMTISMQSAKSASFASEQVQAFFLAQEGLELAQKARDELLLESTFFGGSNPSSWTDFSGDSGTYADCLDSAGCGLAWDKNDSTSLAPVVDCTDPTDCILYLKNPGPSQDDRSRFSYDTSDAEKTLFTRRIYFERTGSDEAVHVRCEVTWRTGSLLAEQKVEVDTYLYNIYDTN